MSSAGQQRLGEQGVKVGWDFLEVEVIFFVAVRTTDFVEMLPCLLLSRELGLGAATWKG